MAASKSKAKTTKKAKPDDEVEAMQAADTVRRQAVFWLISLAIFVALLMLFRSILLPFIAGMVLAYFLDPVADKLEAASGSRVFATSVILLVFLVVFILALIRIVPILSTQTAGLIERLPAYVQQLQALVDGSEWLSRIVGESSSHIRGNLDQFMEQGAGWLSTVLGSIWNSGKALIDVLSLLVITPIVAFYLLLDWDRMVAKVDNWLPRDHQETVRGIARDIDGAIAGFVRGQGSVCLILGTFYAVALTLTGLNFGLLIGMFAGLISFVPFVGSVIGFVLAVGVALVQFWPDYAWIALIGGIFAIGQFVEGNFLQPRLVGKSVGLHPVWLMFSLAAFGALFGFVGLLVAVPVAAAIGVLVRFAIGRYMDSPLYQGHGSSADQG